MRGLLSGCAAGLCNAALIAVTGAWAAISVKFEVGAGQALGMHLLFSSLSGLIFAFALGRRLASWKGAALGGLIFSCCLYLVVAFTVMPLRFGTTPGLGWDFFRVLIGHAIFGLVLGSFWHFSAKLVQRSY